MAAGGHKRTSPADRKKIMEEGEEMRKEPLVASNKLSGAGS